MTPLRLLVNGIVGGFLLFAWENGAAEFFGGRVASSGFLVQYLACCAEAWIACWFLWLAAGRVRTFAWRVVFVATLGLLASLVADLPRWNQGGESLLGFAGRAAQNVLGFTLAGFFLAWRMATFRFVPPQPPRPR
jgi:hypothetical protein